MHATYDSREVRAVAGDQTTWCGAAGTSNPLNPAPGTQKSLLAPQVTWTTGEPDAVVLGRLRNASVVQGLAEERVRVVLQVHRCSSALLGAVNVDPGIQTLCSPESAK